MSKASFGDSFEADHWCLLALKCFLFKTIYCTFYMAILGYHAFFFCCVSSEGFKEGANEQHKYC